MWDNEADLSEIRAGVKRRLVNRRSPIRLFILALIVATIVSNILAVVGQHTSAFPVWFPGFIGILIVVNIIRSRTRRLRPAAPDDDEIERAVRRELRRRGYEPTQSESNDDEYGEYLEKPKRGVDAVPMKHKNDAVVRLGDDGEIIFDESGEEPLEEQYHNRS